MFTDPTIVTLTNFVRGVGIDVLAASALGPTQFPGLAIQNGCVLVDETRVVFPGDILHEAGHLAVTEPSLRNAPSVSPSGGLELAALAWSYAAALHLALDATLVFYPGSFQNMAESLGRELRRGTVHRPSVVRALRHDGPAAPMPPRSRCRRFPTCYGGLR